MSKTHKSTKSACAAPKRSTFNCDMPEEYIPPVIQVKKSARSGLRIEDKLANHQIQTKKKLETLRKSLEEQEISQLRSKPEILPRSRELAEKYERKHFRQLFEPTDSPMASEINNSCTQIQAYSPQKAANLQNITVESVPYIVKNALPKKRTKSLLNLSAVEIDHAERSALFGDQSLADCDISPIIDQSELNNKKTYQIYDSFISTPNSNEPYTDSSDHRDKVARNPNYRTLAPYQVKVSFSCGIDLNSFLRRAK